MEHFGGYNDAGTLLRRYVAGDGLDQALLWFEGAGLGDGRYLHADELGSVIAASTSAGAASLYAYGAYGEPANDNWSGARFRFTGQAALPEARLYHYRARVYDPALGRFLQTDPIGYGDGLNFYAYVGNDPVNATDPLGLQEIVVTGQRPNSINCINDPYACQSLLNGLGGAGSIANLGGGITLPAIPTHPDESITVEDGGITVTGRRRAIRLPVINWNFVISLLSRTSAVGAFTGVLFYQEGAFDRCRGMWTPECNAAAGSISRPQPDQCSRLV